MSGMNPLTLGIIITVIVIIIVIVALILMWWFFIENRVTLTPRSRSFKGKRMKRAVNNSIQTFNGTSGSRNITLYWYTSTSGLYTIQNNNNLQYGCFSSSTTLSGTVKVLFYTPDYSGVAIPLPSSNICNNIVNESIASMTLTAPTSLGTSTATITSVKTISSNDFALIQGESFTINRI